MTPQKQKFLHNPPEKYGDCHRTCIACLLDIPRDEVPNWAEKYWDDVDAWNAAEEKFLAEKGLSKVTVAFYGDSGVEAVLSHMGTLNPGRYYMLTAESRTGTNHAVICCGDKIVWDPSINDSGIVGPALDGYFWLDFLIPLNMVKK